MIISKKKLSLLIMNSIEKMWILLNEYVIKRE